MTLIQDVAWSMMYPSNQYVFIPGSCPPLLVLETPIQESQEIGEERCNGETDLLRKL